MLRLFLFYCQPITAFLRTLSLKQTCGFTFLLCLTKIVWFRGFPKCKICFRQVLFCSLKITSKNGFCCTCVAGIKWGRPSHLHLKPKPRVSDDTFHTSGAKSRVSCRRSLAVGICFCVHKPHSLSTQSIILRPRSHTTQSLSPFIQETRNRCTRRMEHIVVNGSVHTACKQHQRMSTKTCAEICFRVLCERGLRQHKSWCHLRSDVPQHLVFSVGFQGALCEPLWNTSQATT